MTATEAQAAVPLAEFVDAQGHTVRAILTPSGLLALLSHAPGGGLCSGGHPALSAENAAELGTALIEWAKGEGP